MTLSAQRRGCAAFLIGAAVPLCIHLIALLPLYADADLRSRVERAVTQTADAQGWLLSGVNLQRVTAERIRLAYRSYEFGPDTVTCLDVTLASLAVQPCAD